MSDNTKETVGKATPLMPLPKILKTEVPLKAFCDKKGDQKRISVLNEEKENVTMRPVESSKKIPTSVKETFVKEAPDKPNRSVSKNIEPKKKIRGFSPDDFVVNTVAQNLAKGTLGSNDFVFLKEMKINDLRTLIILLTVEARAEIAALKERNDVLRNLI